MPPVTCQEREATDQSGGRNKGIAAFQCRILLSEFRIPTGYSRCDIDSAVTFKEKKNRLSLSVGKLPLGKQLFLGNSGVVNLPTLTFQIGAVQSAVQVVNENVSIN